MTTERILLSAIRHPDGTITDPTGKVWQVVPVKITQEITNAWNSSGADDVSREFERRDMEMPDWEQWARDHSKLDWDAMLAAARPEVKGVELPEWNGKERRCDHDMKWISDWYGDPDVINGTGEFKQGDKVMVRHYGFPKGGWAAITWTDAWACDGAVYKVYECRAPTPAELAEHWPNPAVTTIKPPLTPIKPRPTPP